MIVGVTSTPFKCPPAPSETALLMHDFLTERGLRERSEIALVMPLPVPIPPSPDASKRMLAAFAERGIEWHPNASGARARPGAQGRPLRRRQRDAVRPVPRRAGAPRARGRRRVGHDRRRVDPGRPAARSAPVRPACTPSATSPASARRRPACSPRARPRSSPPDHRAGARRRARRATTGTGMCYLEFGTTRCRHVDVTFVTGQAPVGSIAGPSVELTADEGSSSAPAGSAAGSAATGNSPPPPRRHLVTLRLKGRSGHPHSRYRECG